MKSCWICNILLYCYLSWFVCANSPDSSSIKQSTPIADRFSPRNIGLDGGLPKTISSSGSSLNNGWRSALPKWLRLPDRRTLASLKNSKIASKCLTACQLGIIAYLTVEMINVIREVQKDFAEDSDLWDMGGGSGLNGKGLLSQSAANNLLSWFHMPQSERGPPPRGVPSWAILLTQDLKTACSTLSYSDIIRIITQLTKQQVNLLQGCLLRPSRDVSFLNIGGLQHVKDAMGNWISTNCHVDQQDEDKSRSPYDRLLRQGRQGMVLWGPPGCGKSLLMQAMARQSGWPTLVVTPSLLQRKWYGESTNQVRALFRLVSTLGPCIVVLDELDGLFRSRSLEEHEVSREMKTEWLQWWDGVASSQLTSNSRVLIVAATNRPWDVDPAVWRRLPQRFYVGAPTWSDRCEIWERWSKLYALPKIDEYVLEHMADRTEGYTPSDLFQILQTASQLGPMARLHKSAGREEQYLQAEDIDRALQTVLPTRFTPQYIQQLQSFMYHQNNIHTYHGANQQQQQPGDMVYSVNDATHVWTTPIGNFYQVNIPVDSEVFDALHDIWLNQQEWEASSEEEDDEESDDY